MTLSVRDKRRHQQLMTDSVLLDKRLSNFHFILAHVKLISANGLQMQQQSKYFWKLTCDSV